MTVDGWECEELHPGQDWCMRTAKRGKVEVEADCDGLRIDEHSSGYLGCPGTYGIPANVATWLMQAVR